MPAAFGHGSAAGVRALFRGPSGTGKTLAARHLAAELGRPLYRVDLAAAVNKYIGETEKNLERVFEAAEELDVVLLLDEGDALLAGRTGVSNANDRYANLETNYLLQRLETYDGILIVTTNAAERIDGAFPRRMDVTSTSRCPTPTPAASSGRRTCPPDHAVSDARARRGGAALRAVRRPDPQRRAARDAARAASGGRRSATTSCWPRCSASTARPGRAVRRCRRS